MAVLSQGERIPGYTVQNLIKANRYTETYRVVDGDSRPFFLKLFILNNLPSQLMNEGTKTVREIEYCRELKHRNIVSHVSDGTIEKESGAYQYYLTNYFSGRWAKKKRSASSAQSCPDCNTCTRKRHRYAIMILLPPTSY